MVVVILIGLVIVMEIVIALVGLNYKIKCKNTVVVIINVLVMEIVMAIVIAIFIAIVMAIRVVAVVVIEREVVLVTILHLVVPEGV